MARKILGRIARALGLRAEAPRVSVEDMLASLEPRFRDALISMYRAEPQRGVDGELHAIDERTRIPASQGMWLYDLCLREKPAATLEIGMAFGFSTLFFLGAIAKNGAGRHVAVDPFQRTAWQGIGLAHANALGSGYFDLMEERSDRVATDLARAGARFQLIFIDGAHRFDDVMTDFTLYAPLCPEGGYIILDDMWLESIRTVAAFVRTNRSDFEEVRTCERNIAVFRRVGEDRRAWDHFRRFPAG